MTDAVMTERMRLAYRKWAFLGPAEAADADFDKWLTDIRDEATRDVARRAWHQGATSRQCHCAAYSEGECACGGWPSEPNPYQT